MSVLYEKVNEIMEKAVASGDIAGANLLVLKNGSEEVYCQCGYRDIENKKPVTRDTIFRLYSQTKPVTAAAAVLMVARGEIDLAEDISSYLPEFSQQNVNINGERKAAERRITVRDLLNMTSGIPYPDDSSEGVRQAGAVFWNREQRLYGDNPVTTREFSELMAQNDLVFTPGERFMYGSSADITGALIERVSGMKFSEFLKENFFITLEMNDTDFYVPESK